MIKVIEWYQKFASSDSYLRLNSRNLLNAINSHSTGDTQLILSFDLHADTIYYIYN